MPSFDGRGVHDLVENLVSLAQNLEPSDYDELGDQLNNKPMILKNLLLSTPEHDGVSTHTNGSVDSITHILSSSWNHGTFELVATKPRSKSTTGDGHYPLIRSRSQPIQTGDITSSNFNKFAKNYIIPAAKWAYSPISGHTKTKSKKIVEDDYRIEYSVFKPIKNVPKITSYKEFLIHWRRIVVNETGTTFDYPENYISEAEFNSLVDSVIDLIENDGINPERIAQGSSGSYFIRGKLRNSETTYKVGIFKPKDEEPYGPLSPKWTKWMHRTFFPCFFGRSCLIPNLGYISEAAACTLDRQLLSNIVPFTDVIFLRSPSFYYSYWDKSEDIQKLPHKVGSFQLFLKGYMEAQSWFRLFPIPVKTTELPESLDITVLLDEDNLDTKFRWSRKSLQQFREELEKLVILDYIMRNTDRGADNWMIKIEWKLVKQLNDSKIMHPHIKIGAIDSGLAFPWKRPDEWRSFPFGWLFLPLSVIGQPFSTKTRNHYLPLLTSKYWWEQTVTKLRDVFAKDNDFKERMWLRQLAVLKGQAFNVVEILKLSYAGPLELTRRENLLVWDDIMSMPLLVNNDVVNTMESSIYDVNGFPNTKYTETSPLLEPGRTLHPMYEIDEREGHHEDEHHSQEHLQEGEYHQREGEYGVNGYEYLSHPIDLSVAEETANNRKVIIERLEKVNSKPPVFTWC